MATCLYQETHFQIDPPDSVDSVFVPASGTSTFGLREFPKRRRVERAPAYDEAAFTAQHLASDSSVYFRSNAPRAILWRILDSSQVLELQTVDLYQEHSASEPYNVVLHFQFDSAMIPNGIVLAESSGTNRTLVVHTVTKRGDVVSLALPREAFNRPGVLEERPGAKRWWKTYSPSALKVRSAYRVAVSQNGQKFWIALNDGSLLKLERSENEDGWRESIFSDTTWKSSMRGLISWRGHATARYGDIDLGQKAANTMCTSPSEELLWTASLDHTIRAWGTSSGKVEQAIDLSGDVERDLTQPSTQLIDPNSKNLLQVIPLGGHESSRYLLASYSPQQRLFKFWEVQEEQGIELQVRVGEMYEDLEFKPPIDELIESVGWQLMDFDVKPPNKRGETVWTLWILLRSGSRCHTFNIDFEPEGSSSEKFARAWNSQWTEVHTAFNSASDPRVDMDRPVFVDNDEAIEAGYSVLERWFEWLLAPGLFSHDVLEAALTVYQRGRSARNRRSRADSSTFPIPFKQRLSSAITSATPTYGFNNEEQFFEQEKKISEQLVIFKGVLEDLQKQRERTLSLAIDPETSLPWLLMADGASVVRTCCDVEIIYHNSYQYANQQHTFNRDSPLLRALSDSTTSNAGILMNALRTLRESFPTTFIHQFRDAFYKDVVQRYTRDVTIEERMQILYERTGFGSAFNDETFDEVARAMSRLGGFEELDMGTFESIFDLLGSEEHGRQQRKEITPYGIRVLVAGAQDTFKLELDTLLDVGLLAIFIGCDLDPGNSPSSFSAADIYALATDLTKERFVYNWLASTYQIPRDISDSGLSRQEAVDANGRTLIEALFLKEWPKMKTPKGSQMQLLTYWCRTWIFHKQVGERYEDVVPEIMSWLLRFSDLRLVGQFLKFMPATSWASYVKARYCLAISEYVDAATYFKNAADKLSVNFNVNQYDSGGLLSPDEKNLFGDGHARYYLHLVNLFESCAVPSFGNDFANMALDELEEGESENSPLKNQVLSRLFATSIQTSRYEDAFKALAKQGDVALRRPFLNEFLEALLSASNIDLLLHLPWPPELALEADTHLAELCAKPSSHTASSAPSALKAPDELPSQSTLPPHRLLYAWRIQRGDFRGAAAVLWERTQMIKLAQARGYRGPDVDAELEETYLGLINCLVLVKEKMRWLLVRPVEVGVPGKRARFATAGSAIVDAGEEFKRGSRRIVTVEDVRREYQDHLDRVADLAAGRYPLELEHGGVEDGDEEMQVDTDAMALGPFVPANGAPQGMEVDVLAT